MRRVEIKNRKGLHARASAKLAKLASALPHPVMVSRDGETADARSIMDLLCLAAHQGSFVELNCSGAEADSCLNAVEALIEDGFGELDEDAEAAAAGSKEDRR